MEWATFSHGSAFIHFCYSTWLWNLEKKHFYYIFPVVFVASTSKNHILVFFDRELLNMWHLQFICISIWIFVILITYKWPGMEDFIWILQNFGLFMLWIVLRIRIHMLKENTITKNTIFFHYRGQNMNEFMTNINIYLLIWMKTMMIVYT